MKAYAYKPRHPGVLEWRSWLNVQLWDSAQVVISGFHNRAPHQALYSVWSLLKTLSPPPSRRGLSKIILKKKKKDKPPKLLSRQTLIQGSGVSKHSPDEADSKNSRKTRQGHKQSLSKVKPGPSNTLVITHNHTYSWRYFSMEQVCSSEIDLPRQSLKGD